MTIASGTDWDPLMNQVLSQLLPLLVPVFMGHQRAITWFNQSVEKLLQRTAAGQDSALFRGALSIWWCSLIPTRTSLRPKGSRKNHAKGGIEKQEDL